MKKKICSILFISLFINTLPVFAENGYKQFQWGMGIDDVKLYTENLEEYYSSSPAALQETILFLYSEDFDYRVPSIEPFIQGHYQR